MQKSDREIMEILEAFERPGVRTRQPTWSGWIRRRCVAMSRPATRAGRWLSRRRGHG